VPTFAAHVHEPHLTCLPKEHTLAAAHWLRYARLAYFSAPKSARQLYRLVKRQRICRIFEIGMSDISRSESLIEVAQRYAEGQTVCYTGLDWFEARQHAAARWTLKEAYRLLRATGANVRLVPGEPARSLSAAANAHQNTDLILISPAVEDDDLQAAWFFVPRMLHQRTVILRERLGTTSEPTFEWLTHSQVAEWAGRGGRRAA
jgi:hypothetical protein